MEIVVFSVVLAIIFALLAASVVLFYKDSKYIPPAPVVVDDTHTKPLYECTIKELAERIATEDVTTDKLLKLVDFMAKNFKFPSKRSGESVENHLEFVKQFCLNPSAKGGTIAKMSNTLKAINGEYTREIERYEKMGIRERDQIETKG